MDDFYVLWIMMFCFAVGGSVTAEYLVYERLRTRWVVRIVLSVLAGVFAAMGLHGDTSSAQAFGAALLVVLLFTGCMAVRRWPHRLLNDMPASSMSSDED